MRNPLTGKLLTEPLCMRPLKNQYTVSELRFLYSVVQALKESECQPLKSRGLELEIRAGSDLADGRMT